MSIVQAIQKTSLFQGVESKVIKELASHCHQKKYTKGQQLFAVGDVAESFFIILEGWIKLFRISRDGEETIIHIFGPGESFAEAAVFRDQKSYPVNAQAVSSVQVIDIPRSFFIRKIEQDPRFALKILASISSHQHYLVGQLEQITTRTAPQRVGAFLLRFCKAHHKNDNVMVVDLPYDKSLISTRLNIKPETFSRALSKLIPYSVENEGQKILVRDIKKLEQFCDVLL